MTCTIIRLVVSCIATSPTPSPADAVAIFAATHPPLVFETPLPAGPAWIVVPSSPSPSALFDAGYGVPPAPLSRYGDVYGLGLFPPINYYALGSRAPRHRTDAVIDYRPRVQPAPSPAMPPAAPPPTGASTSGGRIVPHDGRRR